MLENATFSHKEYSNSRRLKAEGEINMKQEEKLLEES